MAEALDPSTSPERLVEILSFTGDQDLIGAVAQNPSLPQGEWEWQTVRGVAEAWNSPYALLMVMDNEDPQEIHRMARAALNNIATRDIRKRFPDDSLLLIVGDQWWSEETYFRTAFDFVKEVANSSRTNSSSRKGLVCFPLRLVSLVADECTDSFAFAKTRELEEKIRLWSSGEPEDISSAIGQYRGLMPTFSMDVVGDYRKSGSWLGVIMLHLINMIVDQLEAGEHMSRCLSTFRSMLLVSGPFNDGKLLEILRSEIPSIRGIL